MAVARRGGGDWPWARVSSSLCRLEVPAGSRPITGGMLKLAVQEGRAGRAPKQGRSAAVPASLVSAVAGYAMLKQVAGDEQKPRSLIGVAVAAVKGTALESKLAKPSQRRFFL